MVKGDIVEVLWRDAFNNPKWLKLEDQHTLHEEGYYVHTIGYLVRSDKIGISVAASLGEGEEVGGFWNIPKGMIESVVVVRKSERELNNKEKKGTKKNG